MIGEGGFRDSRGGRSHDCNNCPKLCALDEVMVGFCNGLAIVIGMAQLHPFHDEVRAPQVLVTHWHE